MEEPWDGPGNRTLTPTRYTAQDCPSLPDHAAERKASYVAVTGPGTAFPGPDRALRFDQIDGSTILAIESAALGPHWMEPRDLEPRDVEDDRFLLSPHGDEIHVLFGDGRVGAVPASELRERLRETYRKGGGQAGNRPD